MLIITLDVWLWGINDIALRFTSFSDLVNYVYFEYYICIVFRVFEQI